MRRYGEKVGVVAEQRGVVAYRHRRDDAVGQAAGRLASPAASAVQLRGGLVVGKAVNREEPEPVKHPPELVALALLARSCKQLHDDDLSAAKLGARGERVSQRAVDGAARGTQKLDPSRAVDDDHR